MSRGYYQGESRQRYGTIFHQVEALRQSQAVLASGGKHGLELRPLYRCLPALPFAAGGYVAGLRKNNPSLFDRDCPADADNPVIEELIAEGLAESIVRFREFRFNFGNDRRAPFKGLNGF